MTHHKSLPPLSRVRELLAYDAATGKLHWLVSRGRARAGAAAGTTCAKGDVEVCVDGQRCKAHRLAWLLTTGQDPGDKQIDHINCVKSDNRLENLRLATNQQNAFNQRRKSTNSTGHKGVWLHPNGRWRARISIDGRSINLGYYDTPESAHQAYVSAASFWHGEFARTA